MFEHAALERGLLHLSCAEDDAALAEPLFLEALKTRLA